MRCHIKLVLTIAVVTMIICWKIWLLW